MKKYILIVNLMMLSSFAIGESLKTSFELSNAALKAVEPNFEPCLPLADEFTSYGLEQSNANNGSHSINFIPNGNPVTKRKQSNGCSSQTLVISSAVLQQPIITKGLKYLDISFFIFSNSNPRKKAIHNCDSSLTLYIDRGDDKQWENVASLCGSHVDENKGWREIKLSLKIESTKKINLGFLYQIQNSSKANPKAKFLIDDVLIKTRK